MRSSVTFIALMSLMLVVAGCGAQGTKSETEQTGPAGSSEPASPPSSEGHAAGIVPGSYEDWCAEHQVQETLCTRCDPSLIPAFQAANDWDAEHGLPMSQCTKHNPNLKIVRPPKPEVQ